MTEAVRQGIRQADRNRQNGKAHVPQRLEALVGASGIQSWCGNELVLLDDGTLLNMKRGTAAGSSYFCLFRAKGGTYAISDDYTEICCLSDGRRVTLPENVQFIINDGYPLIYKNSWLFLNDGRRFTLTTFRTAGRTNNYLTEVNRICISDDCAVKQGNGYLDLKTDTVKHTECAFVEIADLRTVCQGYAFANRAQDSGDQAVVVRLSDGIVVHAFDGEWARGGITTRTRRISIPTAPPVLPTARSSPF